MQNTIQVNDRIIGLRWGYSFKEPMRYDIVIFRFPDDESQLFVKRIVGLPGEVLEIRAGQVYIQNQVQPLDSYFVNGALQGNFGPYVIPQGCYFVLGDNRSHSWDSRFWQNTFVSRGQILGPAVFRLHPSPGLL